MINHLKQYGSITNQQKWYYISSQKYQEIDRFAKHQKCIKYLGTWVTYNKIDLIKKIKNSIKKNMKKVRSFSFFLAPKITYKLEQALYRSLALYHLSPAILTNEINFTDAMKITKIIEKKMKVVPAWCNSELLQWITPNELTISWIRRTIAKQVLNLRNNESI